MTSNKASKSQPDIDYYPDYENYQARSQSRATREQLSTALPEGFPVRIEDESSWGSSIASEESKWLFRLTPEDIQETLDAIGHFRGLKLPLGHINQRTFPLQSFKTKLRRYSRQIHDGLGFVLLRGFPIDQLSPEERVIAFAGVSSYIGNIRALQDPSGVAISHVKDLRGVHKESDLKIPAYTDGFQPMHTDPAEVIGMLVLDVAAEGGESRIASSSTVYNCLARSRPDLVATLSEDWVLDGFVERFGGDPPFTKRPLLLFNSHRRLILHFLRRQSTGFRNVPRSADIPPITEAQAEAIDAVHFQGLANSLKIGFERGDFQFLNNLNMLHSRDGFRDDDTHKRHLLRIWLRDEEYGWQIPSILTESMIWKRLFQLPMEDQWFPLSPHIKIEKFTERSNKEKIEGETR